MEARLDLVILNRGSVSTYRRENRRHSILDITMSSQAMADKTVSWKVLEDYTSSDHQCVTFKLIDSAISCPQVNAKRQNGWNVAKLDKAKLMDMVSLLSIPKIDDAKREVSKANAKWIAKTTMKAIANGCKYAMPKKRMHKYKKSVYWWTDHIAELRRKALKLRRIATRQKPKGDATVSKEMHLAAKKELRIAIKNSKLQCWKVLCKNVDFDTWGLGYKIVTDRLVNRGSVNLRDDREARNIVNALFPHHPERRREKIKVLEDIPPFTVGELAAAVQSCANKKAPGPDNIPIEILKVFCEEQPSMMLNMFNGCLRAGIFYKKWKMQRLVLLDKGKCPPITPSSYRPLCMLDHAGKIYERLIRTRLRSAVDAAGGLSERQHGFRKNHCTIDAVQDVLSVVREAWQGNHRTRETCVMVTFDVKNAFNTARWVDILDALENRFKVPSYLRKVIDDYFNDRQLLYTTKEGTRTRKVTAGVAQGSVLGPDLWNIMYDGILQIELPEYAIIVGYADDIVIVIRARTPAVARIRVSYVSMLLSEWLLEHGLGLATKKTEVVTLTRQTIFNNDFEIEVCGEIIKAKPYLKYLGVWIDKKLTFRKHISVAAEKAARLTGALSRLMPNIDGPSSSKRKLMMSVSNSILLYGSEVWSESLKIECYRKIITRVQRAAALRVCCGYKTIPAESVLIIAGTIPVDLLAEERKKTHEWRRKNSQNIRCQFRSQTLKKWQERWSNEQESAKWTHELISDITPWISRAHGETNFYVTQFLSNHGNFNKYLYQRNLKNSPFCDYCDGETDDARHTFFNCKRWLAYKSTLQQRVGSELTPSNIIRVMLTKEEYWTAVAIFIENVLRDKKKDQIYRTV